MVDINGCFTATMKSIFKDKHTEEKSALVDNMVNKLCHDKHNIDICNKLTSLLTSVSDKDFILNNNIYIDTEFFDGYNETNVAKNTVVFENIHNTHLIGGKQLTQNIYKNPVVNIDVLQMRANVLNTYEQKYTSNADEVQQILERLKSREHYVAWLFDDVDRNVKELYDTVFFRLKGLRRLNNNEHALSTYNFYRILISPLFGILAPIVYFIIPYLVVLYRFKIRLPFKIYMRTFFDSIFNSEESMFGSGKWYKYIRIISYLITAVFYFQGIFSSIDLSRTLSKISKLLVSNVVEAVKYMKDAVKLNDLFWHDKDMSLYFNIKDTHENAKEVAYVNSLCDTPFSLFSNFGRQLKMYKNMDLSIVRSVLLKSYFVDSILGAVSYKLKNNYCYVSYENSKTPYLRFESLEHPSLKKEKVVSNNVEFGKLNKQNAIITSPNSSGKSILIKSILINALLAQTMGVCCAKSATITPFAYICTQMNVPDTTGYESLFEAEMHRCKNTLDTLKDLGSNNSSLSLIIMDEMFNSTNPIEAISGAFAICKKMSDIKSNMLIFTTHLGYLTKLAKECSTFENYRMQTFVSGEDIRFTYIFEKGVNKHLLALELLKKNGFDDDIIKDALVIKNRLTLVKTKKMH
jgi:DNA mismatch repair ATPase MutS